MRSIWTLALALSIISLHVLQSGKVVYFHLNRAEIAEKFCVNKGKPELHCKGSCHLNKQLTVRAEKNEEAGLPISLAVPFWLYAAELTSAAWSLEIQPLPYLVIEKLEGSTNSFSPSNFVPPDQCV